MPLATKSNAIIIKDGKVAESCGCCGFYCYLDSGGCPCNYAKAMPQTLSANLSLNLAGPIYGAATGNFFSATMQCTRLMPSQAATVNGVYTLAKIGFCTYRASQNGVTIQVSVGATCVGGFSLNLDVLTFSLPASITAYCGPDSYCGQVNTQCTGVGFLTNGASRNYPESVTLTMTSPFTLCFSPPFPFFNRGFDLGSRDNPQCSSPLIEQINHSWAIDFVYTDTSGSAPVLGTASRVIHLTVTE